MIVILQNGRVSTDYFNCAGIEIVVGADNLQSSVLNQRRQNWLARDKPIDRRGNVRPDSVVDRIAGRPGFVVHNGLDRIYKTGQTPRWFARLHGRAHSAATLVTENDDQRDSCRVCHSILPQCESRDHSDDSAAAINRNHAIRRARIGK